MDSFKITGQEFFMDENGNVLASKSAMSASKNPKQSLKMEFIHFQLNHGIMMYNFYMLFF